jgi:hypothetical protein
LPKEEIEQIKREMSANAFAREFLCDFGASAEDSVITIEEAVNATQIQHMPNEYLSMPAVFSLDVARFGDDSSVLFMRRGLRAYTPWKLAKASNVVVAEFVVSKYYEHKPERIFVDAGQGQGVIDILQNQLPRTVIEVPFNSRARDHAKFANRRAEMYFLLRDWLRKGGALPPDVPDLVAELSAVTYKFNNAGKIQLEPKEDLKARLGKSPDFADSLALSFAEPVMPNTGQKQTFADTTENVFAGFDYEETGRQQYADNMWS